MRETKIRKKKVKMARSLKNYKRVVFFTFSALLLVLNIVVSLVRSGLGLSLASIEKKESILIGQKRDNFEKLMLYTSLSKTSDKADDMGYVKPASFLYLTDIKPVAQLP